MPMSSTTLGCHLHIPGMVGLSCSGGAWPTCPTQGEATPPPGGHILCIRDQEQFGILPKCSERVHQSGTWIPSMTEDGMLLTTGCALEYLSCPGSLGGADVAESIKEAENMGMMLPWAEALAGGWSELCLNPVLEACWQQTSCGPTV